VPEIGQYPVKYDLVRP